MREEEGHRAKPAEGLAGALARVERQALRADASVLVLQPQATRKPKRQNQKRADRGALGLAARHRGAAVGRVRTLKTLRLD